VVKGAPWKVTLLHVKLDVQKSPGVHTSLGGEMEDAIFKMPVQNVGGTDGQHLDRRHASDTTTTDQLVVLALETTGAQCSHGWAKYSKLL